jgi:hypothetical protein
MIGKSICVTCGIEFKWKRNTANGAAKYCSNGCRPQRKIDEDECEICGKRYTSYRSPGRPRSRFCSKECKYKGKAWVDFEWKKLTEDQKLAKTREIFESHVIRKDGCWHWNGDKDRAGYTRMWHGQYSRGHRVSYLLFKGEIPEGYLVCHDCDNPICTNPKHLFVGTPKDNSADMVRKGRAARNHNPNIGSSNGCSKLDEKKVMKIKEMLRLGVTGSRLAREYGVNKTAIAKIKSGQSWKHVKEPNHD